MPPIPAKLVISLDTETTGLDLHHGAKPYLVTTCNHRGELRWWEWYVDPVTRQPIIPDGETAAIQKLIDAADTIVLHNSKYDAGALATIGIRLPWPKVRDTLLAAHLLASNHKRDLTTLCVTYLGIDIEKYELEIEKITKECRKIAARQFPTWRLAKEGDPMMPSVKGTAKTDEGKPWKNDMWLPRLMTRELSSGSVGPNWGTACCEYANADSTHTLLLWQTMQDEINRRCLWKIYLERLKLLPIAFGMEQRGVTISRAKTEELIGRYGKDVADAAAKCISIAEDHGHELELPAGASPNDSLREMFYGSTRLVCPRCGTETKVKEWTDVQTPKDGDLCVKCKKKNVSIGCTVVRNPCLDLERRYNAKSRSASPTLDKDAMDHYKATLEPGPALDFVTTLAAKRSRDTALSYMESYKRFWIPTGQWRMNRTTGRAEQLWYRLYPSVNPVGTDTLRWSSNNPNSQNISKKESFNLRFCFGPAPGREWWSMDGKNLELRIPAFEAEETELMEVFNHPDDAPYYGSYHLVVFDALHPALFAKHGKKVKDLFESTWYQWVKNGNFAVIYGCQEKKADQTYHVPGAYAKLRDRFPKIAMLADRQKAYAAKYGYVETIPDRSVDPEHGYPILCGRGDDGRIMPTTTLNYHISGTAMQWTNKAMVRCHNQIEQWNRACWDGTIMLQVHDEIVYDAPYMPNKGNLAKMKVLKSLMELGGVDIGVPTPVSLEYHTETWATGEIVQ